MIDYCLAFIFNNDLTQLLLIKKEKPLNQKNKLNGIGGKVEEGETFYDAIVREVKEESNLDIKNWIEVTTDGDFEYYRIGVFTTKLPDSIFYSFKSNTIEKINVFTLDEINEIPLVDNVINLVNQSIKKLKKV